MTVKMFCDGPECEEVALITDPGWWLVQQLRETFHFHETPCLAAWASIASAAALRAVIDHPSHVGNSGGGACSHPWHLREPDRRGGDCPRCGTLAVTEPVPGT